MKKAIIIASFGTSHTETCRRNIEAIEKRASESFTDYKIVRAFTSGMVIRKLEKRDNVKVNNVSEAVRELRDEGIEEIFIQPLHIIPGYEYEKIAMTSLEMSEPCSRINLGHPLLYDESDYDHLVNALLQKLPAPEVNFGVLLVGHGSRHFSNSAYSMLQLKLRDIRNDIHVSNIEGYPGIDLVMDRLKSYEEILLMPLMMVAGEHAANDIAGTKGDSIASRMEVEGIKVRYMAEGLGENRMVQDIFLKKIEESIINN